MRTAIVACLLAAAPVLARAADAPLRDLRIGEADGVVRIVLVCAGTCSAEPDGSGGYRIEGLSDALDYAPPAQETSLRRVSLTAEGDASRLSIETERPPAGVSVTTCEANAVCFDLDLRETAPSLPQDTADAALDRLVDDIERLEAQGAPAAAGSLRARIEAATGTAPSPADCAWASKTVEADGWAVDAYRMSALCLALSGEGREASAMLTRLARYSGEAGDEALARLIAEAPSPLR